MVICPNLKNPEVAREFEELKNATSEAAAYHIWSLNNGNGIDKAPNGAESILFQRLLNKFNGDRKSAIRAKARAYGSSFLLNLDWVDKDETFVFYQGRKTPNIDNRRYNYWTINEREARKNYGPFVRSRKINTQGFLQKYEYGLRKNLNGEKELGFKWTSEFSKLNKEFKEKYGYKVAFDILDNSEEGLEKQNKFFEFIKSKGYRGYREYIDGVEETPYVVTFDDENVGDLVSIAKKLDKNGEPLVNFIVPNTFSDVESRIREQVVEFCNRLGFELREEDADTVIDFASKIITISEFNQDEFDKIKAKVASVLMPPELKNKILKKGEKHGINSTEDIETAIFDALADKQNWIQQDKSLFREILDFIKDFINKLINNQEYFESLIQEAAVDINNVNSKYYRTVIQETFIQKLLDIQKLKESPLYNIYNVLISLGASLDGSAAVRTLGTLYRKGEEDFHDLDFSKPYDDFSWDVYLELLGFFDNYRVNTDNFTKLDKRIYRDLRQYMLENCTEHLKKSKLYKELSKYYSDIRIVHAAKTKLLGLFVTLLVDGNPVDIFYNKSLTQHTINGIKVTDFSVPFAAKLVMRRNKDIRDIINFHKFLQLYPLTVLRGSSVFTEASELKNLIIFALESEILNVEYELNKLKNKSNARSFIFDRISKYKQQVEALKQKLNSSMDIVSYSSYAKYLDRINNEYYLLIEEITENINHLHKSSYSDTTKYLISRIKVKLNIGGIKKRANNELKLYIGRLNGELKNLKNKLERIKRLSVLDIIDYYRLYDDSIYDGQSVIKPQRDLVRSIAANRGVKLDEDYQQSIINHLKTDKLSYSKLERDRLVELAEVLFDYLNKNGFKIRVVTAPYSTAEEKSKSSAVTISGKYATIYYVKQTNQESPFLTLLHELLHVATLDAMPFDGEGRYIDSEQLLRYYDLFVGVVNRNKEIRDAFFKIKNATTIEEFESVPHYYHVLYHATESAGEFLSSFLNEKIVRDYVNNISQSEAKSIFYWLRDLIIETLKRIFKGHDHILTDEVLKDITDFLLNYLYQGYDITYADEDYLKYRQRSDEINLENFENALYYKDLGNFKDTSEGDSLQDPSFEELSSGFSGLFRGSDVYEFANLLTNTSDQVRNKLILRRIIHSWHGDRITKSNPGGIKAILEECEGTVVYPIFHQQKRSIEVEFVDNVWMSEGLYDEIERSDNKSIDDVLYVARILQQKVPLLQFRIIRPSEIPASVRKDANSFVRDGIVYLVHGRATTESTIEEFMHPIVYSIQGMNFTLFESLFNEAKKDFPKLWAEILDTYTDKQGFNHSDRLNELVTQALSRYVHKGYNKRENKTTVGNLIRQAFNLVAKLFNNAIERIGGKAVITPENLPKIKLSLLAKLIIADDSQFRVWTEKETRYNITSHQQKAQKVADDITKRFNVLYKAYEKMPNKSPKRQLIQNEIFETFSKLKRTNDYHAVSIALDFALENLGTWDIETNEPTKYDSISGYLYRQSKLDDPYSGITPETLVEMYENSIGFYEDLIKNYIPSSVDEMMYPEDRLKVKEVSELINGVIKPMWLKAMCIVGDKIVDEAIDTEVDASDDDKANMKTVAKDWLHKNIMYGDIKSYSAYIFNYSYSRNPIIKQAFHLILHAETKTLEEILPISRRITKAFRKANRGFKTIGPNWQTVLMEFDRNGIPTGNFVRDINYGLYELDLTNFIKELNDKFLNKYGYTYIDDGTGVVVNSLTGELAEEEEWLSNGEEPVYITYLKEIEAWKCEHANRRYTINYYNERMSRPYKGSLDPNDVDVNKFGHGLSPKTLFAYNYILSNINYYLDLCTDPETGFSHPERLSPNDKAKLDEWYQNLEDLSNPYEPDGTPKLDDQKQVAFEIRAWQKWLGEQLRTYIDLDAFLKEYHRVVTESNETHNPQLIKDFFKYNSQLGINPDFIELTIGAFPKLTQTDQLAIHAELLRRSLQNIVKTQQGYTRDLEKMEDNPSFWLDCKRTDQIIEDSRIPQSKDFAKVFDENFSFLEIIYRDEQGFAIDSNGNRVNPEDENMHGDLLTYQQYMVNKYTSIVLSSPSRTIPGLNDLNGNPIVFTGSVNDVRNVIERLFTYSKERVVNGEIIKEQVPLSIFQMLIPKKDSFYNLRTHKTEPTMLYVPKGRFAEKYDSGEFMNLDYDNTDLNSELPKRLYYDNTDAFNKLGNGSVKELYDILIETMQESLKNYQSTNRRFNYRLPQINANTMQLLSRIQKQGVGNTLLALYESATSVEENDESMRTNEDYVTNPDGSIATDVPLKYVRKLKHPENITTDVAGSVILFANMALNFKNKSEIDSKLKSLRYNLDYQNRENLYKESKKENEDELSPNSDKNSLRMFDSMVNKHVYGNQWQDEPNQPKDDNRTKVATFKTIKNIQRIETTQTLALNLFSMLVGFGDSMSRILKESLMGKYMSIRDTLTSLISVIRYTPQCIANIGNPLANNKLSRAMQLNGISKGVRQVYEHMNYGRLRKVSSNLLMGGFSMLDWMANALLLRSFYNNVRFYDGDVVEKGFYSSYELQLAFLNAGHTKHEAKIAHMMTNQTLWGAYDKDMNIKPEFEQYVTLKTKTRIRTKTLKRGALYNGMNPDNDIPMWKQDLVGGIIGALRAWLAQATQHLLAGGTDNVVKEYQMETETESFGTKTTQKSTRKVKPITNELRSKAFSWDYETGTPQDQILVGIIRSFKTLFNKVKQSIFLKEGGSKAKFSYVEKYAWKDAIIYLGILAAMMFGWMSVHDWAADVPTPKDRYHAAPEGLSPEQIYNYFTDVYIPNEYYKLQVDNLMFRVIESQITSIDPTSMSDVVNSVTALKNGVSEHLGIIKPIMDITGLSGHTLDEKVKGGGYKFYTRGERSGYKFLGFLDNLHTFFTYYGITENEKFYTNTYGGIYRAFGYDFKKNNQNKSKKHNSNNQSDDRFGGGDFSSNNFGGGGFESGGF